MAVKKKKANNSNDLLSCIIDAIQDKKGKNLISLEIGSLPNAVCQHFVICNADSTTQVNAIADNIEEKTQKVMELIANNADSKGLCLFSHLIIGKSVPEIVDTFVPVLFLCKNGKINAWQEEWFGEIFIQLTKESD